MTGAGANAQFHVRSGQAPDLLVSIKDGKTYTWHVHREVLIKKASVFEAMFRHNLSVSVFDSCRLSKLASM